MLRAPVPVYRRSSSAPTLLMWGLFVTSALLLLTLRAATFAVPYSSNLGLFTEWGWLVAHLLNAMLFRKSYTSKGSTNYFTVGNTLAWLGFLEPLVAAADPYLIGGVLLALAALVYHAYRT